jgi:flavin reductase (DIM6/NTAB) family NADH-FMN oxidoreductase RutF
MNATEFRATDPFSLWVRPMFEIGQRWMLITGGDRSRFNPMTASWGALGVLWERPAAICFVRPSRYTFELLQSHDVFTLSFFSDTYRSVLQFCGAHSGRDMDKAQTCGLIPWETPHGGVTFREAERVLECRRLYFSPLRADDIPVAIQAEFYPREDVHHLLIGEILHVLERIS